MDYAGTRRRGSHDHYHAHEEYPEFLEVQSRDSLSLIRQEEDCRGWIQ